jgi:hypothetical protein
MSNEALIAELNAIPTDDFEDLSIDLMRHWSARGIGLDGVEAVLMFIEIHPNIDIGAPGAIVHFAERFYKKGYEAELVESLKRQPTTHTAWMMNRIINGTESPTERAYYISVLDDARGNPTTDAQTRGEIEHFIKLHDAK